MKLQDVGPTLLGLLGLAPMDPRRGSGLLESDALAPFVLGADRADELRSATAAPRGCDAPDLLVEGASHTRVVRVDGRSAVRDERTGRLVESIACKGPDDDEAREVPVASPDDRALLAARDGWRARNTARERAAEIDPELTEQLRALGYVD